MSKTLCKKGDSLNKKDKKLKYECKKCGGQAIKEEFCCKPKKIKKAA